eukprot:TRINITY_DN3375_c0_g1_i5.p1 TRINITY_DN3375_c0_g1~~TRINITY_DN3375_c0_g1_i5.p1  ORF type:complete len:824 (+),score=84.59 TRINITY_DN3375_c0_g1_i5:2118-4589(+)
MGAISELESCGMIHTGQDDMRFSPLQLGKCMATFYIQFSTTKQFATVGADTGVGELVELLSNASEFSQVSLRRGEKKALFALNSNPAMKFPIAKQGKKKPLLQKIKTREEKISVLLQSILASVEIADWSLRQEASNLFSSATRIMRCLVAYLMEQPYHVALKAAILLTQSLEQKLWWDSSQVCRQLPKIGPSLAQVLVSNNVTTMEALSKQDPRHLEAILKRNAPFGSSIKEALERIWPNFSVSAEIVETSLVVHVEAQNDIPRQRGFRGNYSILLVGLENEKGTMLLRKKIQNFSGISEDYVVSLPRGSAKHSILVDLLHEDRIGMNASTTIIRETTEKEPPKAPSAAPKSKKLAAHKDLSSLARSLPETRVQRLSGMPSNRLPLEPVSETTNKAPSNACSIAQDPFDAELDDGFEMAANAAVAASKSLDDALSRYKSRWESGPSAASRKGATPVAGPSRKSLPAPRPSVSPAEPRPSLPRTTARAAAPRVYPSPPSAQVMPTHASAASSGFSHRLSDLQAFFRSQSASAREPQHATRPQRTLASGDGAQEAQLRPAPPNFYQVSTPPADEFTRVRAMPKNNSASASRVEMDSSARRSANSSLDGWLGRSRGSEEDPLRSSVGPSATSTVQDTQMPTQGPYSNQHPGRPAPTELSLGSYANAGTSVASLGEQNVAPSLSVERKSQIRSALAGILTRPKSLTQTRSESAETPHASPPLQRRHARDYERPTPSLRALAPATDRAPFVAPSQVQHTLSRLSPAAHKAPTRPFAVQPSAPLADRWASTAESFEPRRQRPLPPPSSAVHSATSAPSKWASRFFGGDY